MTTEKSLIDSALRGWKFNVERADEIVWGPIARTTGATSCSRKEPSNLSVAGPSCGGERSAALAAARDRRKTSSRIRRHVHLEPGQVCPADRLETIAQSRLARNQPEALGGFREVLRLRLGAAAHCGVGTGFRARTAPESIRGAARKNRSPCLSLRASSIGAANTAAA